MILLFDSIKDKKSVQISKMHHPLVGESLAE